MPVTRVVTKSKNWRWLLTPTTKRSQLTESQDEEYHLPQFHTQGQWLDRDQYGVAARTPYTRTDPGEQRNDRMSDNALTVTACVPSMAVRISRCLKQPHTHHALNTECLAVQSAFRR